MFVSHSSVYLVSVLQHMLYTDWQMLVLLRWTTNLQEQNLLFWMKHLTVVSHNKDCHNYYFYLDYILLPFLLLKWIYYFIVFDLFGLNKLNVFLHFMTN